jgi:succinoglycan biosynthesis transport protein ExoP
MEPSLQDPLSTPRRAMDIEDYIDIIRRHRGWILGPMFAALVLGTVVAFVWPDTYVSAAVIRVIPPQIPERFVPTNINADISQRINSIYQSITSRSALTNIINLYQLYPRDRKRLPLDDVVEQMRKDIKVNFVGMQQGSSKRDQGVQAFQISFAYENRILAQKIVTEMVTRFIDENIRTRASQSVMTTDFLRDQWEQRKRDLDAIEDKLTKFRQANQGRLPEERANLQQAMNMFENRISNLNTQIARANQDKLLLESKLNILKDQLKVAATPETSPQVLAAKNERLVQLEKDILNAETSLEALLNNYRETHPDVRRVQANIAVLKRQRDNLRKQEEAKAAEVPAPNAAPAAPVRPSKEVSGLESEIASVQSLIESRNLEIDNYQKELQGVDRNLRSYQGRLESMPSSITEYEDLIREKRLAQEKYEEMNAKMAQSQSATELENRKQGETLELLDQASLPVTPAQPKRPLIVGASAVAGLLLGLLLAGARELKDSTLKNLKDVRAYTQLMILGSVPLLENDLVVKRRRRLGWLAWSTACLAGIAIMAGSVFYYYANKT